MAEEMKAAKIGLDFWLVQDWSDGSGKLDSQWTSPERAQVRADQLPESTVTKVTLDMDIISQVERRGYRHEEPLTIATVLRDPQEIAVAEEELRQRIWYDTHLRSGAAIGLSPQQDQAIQQARRLAERRPDLGPAANDLERTQWHARLETLRWVMGEDWGNTAV